MKKAISSFILLLILIICLTSFIGCNSSDIKIYEYVHTNGAISTFEINFKDNSWKYDGINIALTLYRNCSYEKATIGARDICNGKMELTDDFGGGDKFFMFTSINANVDWNINVYVKPGQNEIVCYIGSSSGYIFRLKK